LACRTLTSAPTPPQLPACWQHRLTLPDVAAVFVGAIIMTLLFFFFSVLNPYLIPFGNAFGQKPLQLELGG